MANRPAVPAPPHPDRPAPGAVVPQSRRQFPDRPRTRPAQRAPTQRPDARRCRRVMFPRRVRRRQVVDDRSRTRTCVGTTSRPADRRRRGHRAPRQPRRTARSWIPANWSQLSRHCRAAAAKRATCSQSSGTASCPDDATPADVVRSPDTRPQAGQTSVSPANSTPTSTSLRSRASRTSRTRHSRSMPNRSS